MQDELANERFPDMVKRFDIRQVLLENSELLMQGLEAVKISFMRLGHPIHGIGCNGCPSEKLKTESFGPTFNRFSKASVFSLFPVWINFSAKSNFCIV